MMIAEIAKCHLKPGVLSKIDDLAEDVNGEFPCVFDFIEAARWANVVSRGGCRAFGLLRDPKNSSGGRMGPVDFVRGMEEALIRVCLAFGVRAGLVKGLTGVWCGVDEGEGSREKGAGNEEQGPGTKGLGTKGLGTEELIVRLLPEPCVCQTTPARRSPPSRVAWIVVCTARFTAWNW